MKILLFNTFYYPKFVGGAEISVQLLAEGLVKNGHNVYVITIGRKNEVERLNGVLIIRVKSKNISSVYDGKKQGKFSAALWLVLDSFNPFYHYRLLNILKRINPDVVHTNNIMGFSPTIWFTIKKLKLPLVHTLRDYYLLCHKCTMFNRDNNCESICSGCSLTHRIKSLSVRKPDVFVGVSKYVLNKHDSLGEFLPFQKKKVVYNAVALPNTDVKKIGIEEDRKIIFGYMGRLSEEKGIGYLVDQMRNVHEMFPNTFELLLAGRGDEEYIDLLKHRLGDINYKFLGKIEPKDFYEEVDVTVVPSMWQEPFGRVAIESLAFGVPVCLASNGGLSEIHKSDCTWLFKPVDKELSDIVIAILKDRSQIGKKAKGAKSYAAEFGVDENINAYLDIYKEVS